MHRRPSVKLYHAEHPGHRWAASAGSKAAWGTGNMTMSRVGGLGGPHRDMHGDTERCTWTYKHAVRRTHMQTHIHIYIDTHSCVHGHTHTHRHLQHQRPALSSHTFMTTLRGLHPSKGTGAPWDAQSLHHDVPYVTKPRTFSETAISSNGENTYTWIFWCPGSNEDTVHPGGVQPCLLETKTWSSQEDSAAG